MKGKLTEEDLANSPTIEEALQDIQKQVTYSKRHNKILSWNKLKRMLTTNEKV